MDQVFPFVLAQLAVKRGDEVPDNRAERSVKLREGSGVTPLRPQQQLRVIVGVYVAARTAPLSAPSAGTWPSWRPQPGTDG